MFFSKSNVQHDNFLQPLFSYYLAYFKEVRPSEEFGFFCNLLINAMVDGFQFLDLEAFTNALSTHLSKHRDLIQISAFAVMRLSSYLEDCSQDQIQQIMNMTELISKYYTDKDTDETHTLRSKTHYAQFIVNFFQRVNVIVKPETLFKFLNIDFKNETQYFHVVLANCIRAYLHREMNVEILAELSIPVYTILYTGQNNQKQYETVIGILTDAVNVRCEGLLENACLGIYKKVIKNLLRYSLNEEFIEEILNYIQ
ncbi:Hypothetical_protein [Hexamita inflata]|uniref:Hypothetical_protein n=1 Tax=Hexamita inflata TaxID=28002 RepID=A0AA86Q0U8_9EUKA|nr:Hypothetical protein HINF_LOCUS36146 [Hexamita inflata]